MTAQALIDALQQLIDDGDLDPKAAVRIMLPYPTGGSNEGSADGLDVVTDRAVWIMPFEDEFSEQEVES